MAVGIVIAVLASTLSGWYQRADMVLRTNSSMIIMILIAVVAIVLFIGLFSIHHQWDQHEQRYQQFLQKEKEDAAHLINNQS
jgi:predicted PurR-regulated permease PerM